MVNLPTYETEETKRLNLEIAKKSHGVCLLLFSGGKDSLLAWMVCKRHFRRVVPIHCASFPCSKYKEEYLRYVEEEMGDHVLRMVGEEVSMGTARGMYQLPDELDLIEGMEVRDYSKLDILEEVRYALNLPRCWCAVGMNIYDSIDRRIYINKYGGKNANNLTFYPFYDWPKPEIVNALRQGGVRLSSEYRYASRTLGGVPSYTCLKILREHYPEDYERELAVWPLAEAKSIRERYLDRAWAERKAAGVVDDGEVGGGGGVSPTGSGGAGVADEYESDDGTDVMPEFGM